MISIDFSDARSVNIACDEHGIRALREAIAICIQAGACQVSDADWAIDLRLTHTKFIAAASGGRLLLRGDAESLDSLDASLQALARSNARNAHVHHEYFETHPLIEPDSVPLVFTKAVR